MKAFLSAAVAAALFVPSAHAAEHVATAATLPQVFLKAADGDVIHLKGDFPLMVLQGRSFGRTLKVDASGARLTAVVMKKVGQLEWVGGQFTPAGGRPAFYLEDSHGVTVRNLTVTSDGTQNGVTIRDSADVALLDSQFNRPRVAVSVITTDRAHIARNQITGWSGDGIGLSSVSDSVIEGNTCTDPVRVDQDIHIDCIQGYFTGAKPNRQLIVRGNKVHGQGTQGIFFNSYKGYPPPQGITITDNTVETADAPNGVLLEDDPDGDVHDNHVSTLPGSKWQTRVAVLHAKTHHCGNKIDGYQRWRPEEEDACRKH